MQAESEEVRTEFRRLQTLREIRGRRVCLGLDRLDYTKGIPERLRAFERLLTKYPHLQRKIVFVQAGPESRTAIPRYRALKEEIVRFVAELNRKYGSPDWAPVVLLRQHLSLAQVLAWYRLAEVCVVSSLHDGMNLVAKEYIATKNDKDGVLVLSRFTGSARELDQALLINPYDTEAFADILAMALDMDVAEREARMHRLRDIVKSNNIYRWAGKILTALAALPRKQSARYSVSAGPLNITAVASEA
jgi:trehalose 6-phosphate synthase